MRTSIGLKAWVAGLVLGGLACALSFWMSRVSQTALPLTIQPTGASGTKGKDEAEMRILSSLRDARNLADLYAGGIVFLSLPDQQVLELMQTCAKLRETVNPFICTLLAERLEGMNATMRGAALKLCRQSVLHPVISAWGWLNPAAAVVHPEMLLPAAAGRGGAQSAEPWQHLTVVFGRLAELDQAAAIPAMLKLTGQPRLAAWRGILGFAIHLKNQPLMRSVLNAMSDDDKRLYSISSVFPDVPDNACLLSLWRDWPANLKLTAAYRLGQDQPLALLDDISAGTVGKGVTLQYLNGLLSLSDRKTFEEMEGKLATLSARGPAGLKTKIMGSLAVAASINFPGDCVRLLESLPPGNYSNSIRSRCISGMAGIVPEELSRRLADPNSFPDAEFRQSVIQLYAQMRPKSALSLLGRLPEQESQKMREELVKLHGAARLGLAPQ